MDPDLSRLWRRLWNHVVDLGHWLSDFIYLIYSLTVTERLTLVGSALLLIAVHYSLGLWTKWLLLPLGLNLVAGGVFLYQQWTLWFPSFLNSLADRRKARSVPPLRPLRRGPIRSAWVSLLRLTVGFTTVSAILASHDWLGVRPKDDASLVFGTLAFYVWHLLDAVPLLKIPETLHWQLKITYTGTASGALLLAFKVLAILPVFAAIKRVIEEPKADSDSANDSPSEGA